MGDCAEMVLDGILVWDGSYDEKELRGKVYPKQIFESGNKVTNLLRSRQIKSKNRLNYLTKYAVFMGWETRNYLNICKKICINNITYNAFKKYTNDQI